MKHRSDKPPGDFLGKARNHHPAGRQILDLRSSLVTDYETSTRALFKYDWLLILTYDWSFILFK